MVILNIFLSISDFDIINDTISHNSVYNASDYVYDKPVIAQDIKAYEGAEL
jgi:hypothetical protein